MAIHYNPTTVSDGLVLALDAANTRSYGGSGTTWTDVSYNGNNGTLTNGPAYTTVGFTEPFGGAGGVYFDGSSDTLTLDGSAGNAGTGDFTMEFWFKGSKMEFNDNRTLHITSNGTNLYFQLIYGGTIILFSNSDWRDGNWHHHAIVRTGSTVKWYIDGVRKGTGTDSRSTNSATNFLIGQGYFGYMNGYVSNFRFVTSALYTEDFTPPRSLLTAVANTSLLTCQKGSITDASSNNFAITVNGDARPVYGFPSFKFDGSNDGVSLPTITPTGGVTFSAFIYINGNNSNFGSVFANWDDSGSKPYWIGTVNNNATSISVYFNGSLISAFTSLPYYTWIKMDVSHNGSVCNGYINGDLKFSSSSTLTTSSYVTSIGYDINRTNYPFKGNIAQASIYNKALTAEEVQQNYNALKGRFGL